MVTTFTVGNKKSGIWQVKIDDKYIMDKVKLGIRDTANRMVKETQSMASTYEPNIYQDMFGVLSQLLRQLGLAETTESGALRDAWKDNISKISVKNGASYSTIRILDYGILNRKTQWYGVMGNPSVKKQDTKKSKTGDIVLLGNININGAGAVSSSDSAMRPLPASGGGFTFYPNPYPGNGYWKLYHNGLATGKVSYKPDPFIVKAFKFMFGSTTFNIVNDVMALKIDNEYRQHISLLMSTMINKRLGR